MEVCPMLEIIEAVGKDLYLDAVRELFTEYADSLDFDLDFQDFQTELDSLPGKYAPPGGTILLALSDGKAAGCVAMRSLSKEVSEMKRLFIRPQYRGCAMGRELAKAIIDQARSAGYSAMRLDTIDTMGSAISLYRSLGFREIPAYCYNPLPGALFFELNLQMI
jgi:ribosomal protein S18 acetylase RimI-like enzyme